MTLIGWALLSLAPQQPDTGATLIDEHVRRVWSERSLKPSGPATDEEFLRRVTLDLTGNIPTAEASERYAADMDPGKRVAAIDELLASPAHSAYWAQLWTIALMDWTAYGFETFDRIAFRDWLRDQFAARVPWNKLSRAILGATGDQVRNPAVNFGIKYLQESPEAFATRVTKTFFGVRLQCAQCHDHPFDAWKRGDFYGLASFGARTQIGAVTRNGDFEAYTYSLLDVQAGDGIQPQGFDRPAAPSFLGRASPSSSLWRQEFALMLTRDRQFARAFVNRTWSQLMGRGIVHPPENFGSQNPPTHPALLEALTTEFVAGGYDVRTLIRRIVDAEAYRLGSADAGVDPANVPYYVVAIQKPLNPYQLFNAMARATGMEKDYAGLAGDFSDRREEFIQQFFEVLDADATASNQFVENAQGMLNKLTRDYLVDTGVSEPNSLLTALMAAEPEGRIGLLYRSLLGRAPTPAEREICLAHLSAPPPEDDPTRPTRDLFYAIINSHEFNFNH
jgi:hypothetical protein